METCEQVSHDVEKEAWILASANAEGYSERVIDRSTLIGKGPALIKARSNT